MYYILYIATRSDHKMISKHHTIYAPNPHFCFMTNHFAVVSMQKRVKSSNQRNYARDELYWGTVLEEFLTVNVCPFLCSSIWDASF
jgi:hypothetical protein